MTGINKFWETKAATKLHNNILGIFTPFLSIFFLFIFYFCFSVFCLLWRRENFLDDEDEKMRMRKGVDICGWVCLAEMNKQWIYREESNESKYKQVKEYVVSWAPADRIYSLFNLFLLLLYIIFYKQFLFYYWFIHAFVSNLYSI